MNNQMGLEILSSVIQTSYPNFVLSKNKDNSYAIDVKELHSLLLTGSHKKENDTFRMGWGGGMHNPMSPMLGFGGGLLGFGGRMLGFGGGRQQLLRMQKISEGRPDTPSITLSPTVLDERFHFDFTSITDKTSYNRGGSAYIRPCGWRRYALKVHGVYDDDIWLLGKSKRPDQYSSAEEEWPVSYHGTSYNNGLKIAEEGYRLSKCKRFKHGDGIYSTPDINVALLYAERTKLSNGKTYRVVIQNRNNPENLVKIDEAETGVGEYWISPSKDDIRPYGLCTREC